MLYSKEIELEYRMEIQKLSDAQLKDRLPRLVESERAAIVDVLLHLVELDKRSLYRELGYSSLFDLKQIPPFGSG